MNHIRLKSLLTEALDQLFHATDLNRLLKILQNDAIKLTYADGSDIESKLNQGFPFYLSTSREKFGGYARRGGGISNAVVLVLDGRALERVQGIKMVPVDYWAGNNPNNDKDNETEERVLSQKQVLSNIKRYIIEIHIYCNTHHWEVSTNNDPERSYRFIVQQLIPTLKLTEAAKIPTYVYIGGDRNNIDQAYKQQRKSFAMSPTDAIKFFNRYVETSTEIHNFVKNANPKELEPYKEYTSSYEQSNLKELEYFMDMMVAPEEYVAMEYSNETKAAHDIVKYFTTYTNDLIPHFSSSIQNMRSKHPEIFTRIAKAIRAAGFTTLKGALVYTSEVLSALTQIKSIWGYQRDVMSVRLRYIENTDALASFNRNARDRIVELLSTEYRDTFELDEAALKKLADILKREYKRNNASTR